MIERVWIMVTVLAAPLCVAALAALYFTAVARYHREINVWDEARALSWRDACRVFAVRYAVGIAAPAAVFFWWAVRFIEGTP